MLDRVINLVQVFTKAVIKLRERPSRVSLRIHGFGDLPDVSHNLCVSPQVVHELGVTHLENALANGPEPWLRRRSNLFGALVIGQQRLEIRTFEFFPSVNHHDLRKPLVSAHALTQDHHARTITWWVEGEIDRRHAPAVGVDEQRQPRAAQYPPRARTDDLHIQFGVVDMANFERPVPVPRRLQLKFEIKRFQGVSTAATLSPQP